MRAQLIALSFLLTASGSLALMASPLEGDPTTTGASVALGKDDAPPVAAGPAAPAPDSSTKPQTQAPQPTAKPAVPAAPDISAYRGMGAWVDMYDFNTPTLPPPVIVNELATRGVRTLFLQTGRWNLQEDILDPAALSAFIELSHARGMKVVAWYLPGFADNDFEMRRTMAAINFRTPTGQSFDGFAPDIEDFRAVGKDMNRFAAGIADYSRRLREAVGPRYALGAIVVDAKNNKRAPAHWAPFPWPEIGRYYDVVVPMAYWSVVKRGCGDESDVVGYMREMVAETRTRMGADRPFHIIGGIADCNSGAEIKQFVDVSFEIGAIGGSLYDFRTTHFNPAKETIWSELARLNTVKPSGGS